MTVPITADDGPTQTSAAARLGALAGVTPVVMVISLAVIMNWGWEPEVFTGTMLVVTAISVVGGWFVGPRVGRSIWSSIRGAVTYLVRGYLVILTIGLISAIASMWSSSGDGGSIVFLALYALVCSLFVFPALIPFGAGWALTYYALRRAMRV